MAAEDWYPGAGNDPIDTSGKYVDASGTMRNASPAAGGLDISSLLKAGLANRGRKSLKNIYEENWLRNKQMMEEAYTKSLPKPITGPAGMVTFDEDEEEMLMELDEGTRALRESWFRAEERAGEELAAYDIDERTIKKIGMFDAANYDMDRARQQELVALNYAQGIEGTPGYWKQRALDDQRNQRRLQEAIQAHPMSLGERSLLSAEQIAFGNAAIDAPRMLMQQGDLSRALGQGSHTGVNVAGTSLASMALADTQAGFWSGLMGGMGQYGAPKTGGSTGGGGMLGGLLDSVLNPYGSSIFTTNNREVA